MSTDVHAKQHNSQPRLHHNGSEIQKFGTLRLFPIALAHEARMQSAQLLNRILADSTILYALYKKHHWLVRGHTFYQLHLLLDKHAGEQLKLIDMIAERVQTLGAVAVGDPNQRRPSLAASLARCPSSAGTGPVIIASALNLIRVPPCDPWPA